MECVAVFLFLVTAFTGLAVALASRINSHRGRRRLFQQLAHQFSGSLQGGFFSRPVMRLRYGETLASVSEVHVPGPFRGPALQVRVAWPHAHVRCEIVARSRNRPRKLHLSWPRVPVDYGLLGQEFVVAGFNERDVRELLTSGVGWSLERLRVLGDDHRLHVLIHDGQIIVRKYWPHPRGAQPAQFVQCVLELYDQCMLAKACGIEFLNVGDAQMLDNVTCKICGDAIREEMVYCRRCKTPHHLECWRYTGRCSIFGCRETVYLVPRCGVQLPESPQHPGYPNKPR
jgi:hypothetical protein